MVRRLVVCGAMLLALLLSPIRTEAAVIQCFDSNDPSCEAIGLFSWAEGFLTDDVFTVVNTSDQSSLQSAFENAALILDGSTEPLGTIDAPGQTDTGGINLFFGTTSARLEFSFLSTPFAVELNGLGDIPIYAQSVVPEPSTIVLLGTGITLSQMIRRRRRHR